MPNLVEIIKIAAMEAVNESKPTAITFGEVTSTAPLKIQVDQKLPLTSAQLMLANDVRDCIVDMTIDGVKKSVTIHNALKVGDNVIMIQVQGGQKYLVLEKVVMG